MAKSEIVPFATTQIKILMGKEAANSAITLSNTNPAKASDIDGLSNADVIIVSGAVNGIYMVSVEGSTATVLGLDLSDYSAPVTAQYAKGIMSTFCDMTGITVDNGSKSYKKITTNCDNYPQEKGTVEAGTVSLDINYNHDAAIQQKLEDYFFTDENIYIQVKPNHVNTLKGHLVSVASFNHNAQAEDDYKGNISFKMKAKGQRLEIK